MKQSELIAEIEMLIDEAMEDAPSVSTPWLVQTMVSRHSRLEGEDLDCALLCMNEHFRDSVGSTLRKMRPHPEDEQAFLPGVSRIQKRYLIERDGEDYVVATPNLTAPELRRKATEYRRMGAGCFAHADELERLAADRDAAA